MELQKKPNDEIQKLCNSIRKMLLHHRYEECEHRVLEAIKDFPHAPEPHNLYGIVLEKQGKHLIALKHFRVALSLEPSYSPAIHNLETYATFFSHGTYAVDESDCEQKENPLYETVYDSDGIGHIQKRRG